jgi:GAF domain-containing protein
MQRSTVPAVMAMAMVLGSTGCAWMNRVSETRIVVQFSGDQLLHVAILPRRLPDGSEPTKQLKALLDEMAERAGGYTYIPQVVGGWRPPGEKATVEQTCDLLLVKGPPEIAYVIDARLREDFGQKEPVVVSLPIQAIAVVPLLQAAPPAAQPAPAGSAR